MAEVKLWVKHFQQVYAATRCYRVFIQFESVIHYGDVEAEECW